MLEDLPSSPAGFASFSSKSDAASDIRKPLSCLNGNAPAFNPYFQHQFQEQSPMASYLVSPLSKLRLDEGVDIDTSVVDARSRALLPSWVLDSQG
ncbi:unnamed protein product, partial [Strongylus vulgaris]